MDKEQKRISRLLKEMREELDEFSTRRRWLRIGPEKRWLLRFAIVQLELLRARNTARDTAVRVNR